MAKTLSETEIIEKRLDKQQKAREKRKTRKMKVSGKSVFALQKIIRKKSSKC